MLPVQETDLDIIRGLVAANLLGNNPHAALKGIIGPIALGIPFQPSPLLWAEVTVRFCLDLDWDADGTHPFLKLLAPLRPLNERIPVVIQTIQSLPRPADPFAAREIDNGRAFLSRDQLRRAVKDMLRPDGPCVLRIGGAAKCGKSYSFQFLQFLRAKDRALKPVLVENPGPATTAATVAQTLVRRMGGDASTMPNLAPETPLRAGQILADWVLNIALRGGDAWWFVLDGFSGQNLPDDTKEFIRQIGLQIPNGVGRDRLRLVLIDSEADLPRELRLLQRKDELKLDRTEWESVLRQRFAELAPAIPANKQADLVAALDDALEQIRKAPDAEFLQTLAESVEDAVLELAA